MRSRIRKITIVLCTIIIAFSTAKAQSLESKYKFKELPYAYNALEPAFDAQTMELHYSKHHKGYYTKFLKAIADSKLKNLSLEEIFAKASSLDNFLRNNAGGYYNHTLFWENLSPNPTKSIPLKLKQAIEKDFGSIEKFKDEFIKQASSVFGSGWAWLVLTPKGKLAITTTQNQDNPLMNDVKVKGTPLLALDVWEHAYYLKYQNNRSNYIEAFWNIIDWDAVEKRMK